MKKLNNKGFAVSSLLYGLMLVAFLIVSILMSIMSTNRKNTSTLIKKIEEELNRYSQTTTTFSSTEGAQEFIVPYGKAGWYKIELWGGAAEGVDPTSASPEKKAGYTSGVIYLEENTHLYFQIGSKGGTGGTPNNTNSVKAGGATDVRLVGGNWSDESGLASRIMVAGGGGVNNAQQGTGYTVGYNNHYNGNTYISGYGVAASHPTYGFINTQLFHGVYSGEGKATIELVSTNSKDNPPEKKTKLLENVRYIKDCITSSKSDVSKERWTEIQAFDSNGQNVALNKIATIDGNTVNEIVNGNIDDITSSTYSNGSGEKCVVVDLGATYNLEEIAIFHQKDDSNNRTYKTENISVSANGSDYSTLKSWSSSGLAPQETDHGVRYSSRDLEGNSDESIPTGNYFIQNATSLYVVLTSQGSSVVLSQNVGEKSQRWAVMPTGDEYYYLVEAANSNALQPLDQGQEIGEAIGTPEKYGKHTWEEWYLKPLNNGYYQFQSRFNPSLCMQSVGNGMGAVQMATCDANQERQWYKFLNADY